MVVASPHFLQSHRRSRSLPSEQRKELEDGQAHADPWNYHNPSLLHPSFCQHSSHRTRLLAHGLVPLDLTPEVQRAALALAHSETCSSAGVINPDKLAQHG